MSRTSVDKRPDRPRVVVFGYHTIGFHCLRHLLDLGEEIVSVVTHEDDPAETVWFESVGELARSRGIPVHLPANPNRPEFVALIRSLSPDLLLSFWYRRLLCRELLEIPRLGAVNLHGSLLPRYRGRSPVNWVLLNGETETGVTLHYMTEEADAGDIVAQRTLPIDPDDTALTLYRKMVAVAVKLFGETYPLLKTGRAPRIPQDAAAATVFGRRTPEDGLVRWHWPAARVHNLIRGVTHPYPGAFTHFRGKRLFLWDARPVTVNGHGAILPGAVIEVRAGQGLLVGTGSGSLLLVRVQLDSEEELAGDEFARRHGVGSGQRLGG
jgi:methionyl-tRNA formyltransferase